MKYRIVIIIALFVVISFENLKAQNPFQAKEQYDDIYGKIVDDCRFLYYINYSQAQQSNPDEFNPLEWKIFDNRSQYQLGDGTSVVLSSLVKIYETTKDKAYLYKAINWAIKIIAYKNCYRKNIGTYNYQTNNLAHKWTKSWLSSADQNESTYQNAKTLSALAELYYCIKTNATLYNTGLLQNIIETNYNTLSIYSPPANLNSFGDFANWLSPEIDASLNYFANSYFDSNYGMRQDWNDTRPDEFNRQSPFAMAWLYMGLANNNINQRINALIIANKIKSVLSLSDVCENETFNKGVLQLNTSNNAFEFSTYGWRIPDKFCWNNVVIPQWNVDDINEYKIRTEDISHAVDDFEFPIMAYNLYPGQFDIDEMVRFRNMFTKQIFNGNNSTPGFHLLVSGNTDITNVFDVIKDNCVSPNKNELNCFGLAAVFNYMPFYKFDGADATANGSNVYDVLMKYYEQNMYNKSYSTILANSTGIGATYKGLSKLVAAQWERECVNLTLKNRNLAYNQDFFVKNKLIISPSLAGGLKSFAEPFISSNRFIIKNGVTSNITAGEEIALLVGFEAEEGSDVRIRINTNACTDGNRIASINNNTSLYQKDKEFFLSNQDASNTMVPIEIAKFSIYPNPAKSIVTINAASNELITIVFTDMLGNIILQEFNRIGNSETEINIENLPKGIYFVTAKTATKQYVSKLVKE